MDVPIRLRLLVPLICAAGLIVAPSAARAATITVGTTDDISVTECTLRDAITAANTDGGSGACHPGSGTDAIDFDPSVGGTITLGTPLPDVTSSLDIQGPGASKLTVSGNDAVQVLAINSGNVVSISGLTVFKGLCDGACGGQGGGILNNGTLALNGVDVMGNVVSESGGTNAFPEGGGIANSGTLTIVDGTVSDNVSSATGATNQNGPNGGGIFNSGTLTLDRTTVSGNTATAAAGGGSTTNATGGGIADFGTLIITRSTLSANTASGTGASSENDATGGAISVANSPGVHVTITDSTVSGNTATAGAPGQADSGGVNLFTGPGTAAVASSTITGNTAPIRANVNSSSAATFTNTIVSNPLGGGPNCPGPVTSQGYNLEDTNSCGFNQPTDHPSTVTGLDPNLAVNGGPTKTHALLGGSAAIDQGVSSCTTDQRGLPRPSDDGAVANAAGGDGTDIGAFELQSDTTPPDTTIDSGPADGSVSNNPAPSFGFSGTEVCSTFQCRLDGGAFSACSSPNTTASLPDGQHTFSVRSLDGSTNADPTPASRTFTVDTLAPETKITKGPKRKTRKRKAKLSFKADEPGSTFECKLDKKPFSSCSSPVSFKHLKPGKHTFQVEATDQAGNTDATPARKRSKVVRRR